MNPRNLSVLFLCFLGLLLSGTVLGEKQAEPTKERLLERAHAYWDAVKIRDIATAYGFEAGAVTGQLKPETMRRVSERSRLLSYEFKEVEIDGEDAVIQIDARYALSAIKSPLPQQRSDPWMFMEGDWYHGKSRRSANAGKTK